MNNHEGMETGSGSVRNVAATQQCIALHEQATDDGRLPCSHRPFFILRAIGITLLRATRIDTAVGSLIPILQHGCSSLSLVKRRLKVLHSRLRRAILDHQLAGSL